jgi:EamA domain-containing membrane protein RarD
MPLITLSVVSILVGLEVHEYYIYGFIRKVMTCDVYNYYMMDIGATRIFSLVLLVVMSRSVSSIWDCSLPCPILPTASSKFQ